MVQRPRTLVRRLVTGEPALLVYRGEYLQDALRRERVSEEEVLAAARASGFARLDHTDAVILETDGTFSVVRSSAGLAGGVGDRVGKRESY